MEIYFFLFFILTPNLNTYISFSFMVWRVQGCTTDRIQSISSFVCLCVFFVWSVAFTHVAHARISANIYTHAHVHTLPLLKLLQRLPLLFLIYLLSLHWMHIIIFFCCCNESTQCSIFLFLHVESCCCCCCCCWLSATRFFRHLINSFVFPALHCISIKYVPSFL